MEAISSIFHMNLYEDRDIDSFYKSNLFASTGKLFQLAYADRAPYLSEYRLFLRPPGAKGWYIFENNPRSLAKKINSERECKIIGSNSHEYIFDPRVGVLVTFYGHWYSRNTAKKRIEKVIDAHPTGHDPGLLLRKILSSNLSVSPNIAEYYSMPQEIYEQHVRRATSEASPHPSRGHSFIAVTSYDQGVRLDPSDYHQVSHVLSMGGGDDLTNKKMTEKILDLLGIDESSKKGGLDQKIYDLDTKFYSQNDPHELSHSVSYFCDVTRTITHKGYLYLEKDGLG